MNSLLSATLGFLILALFSTGSFLYNGSKELVLVDFGFKELKYESVIPREIMPATETVAEYILNDKHQFVPRRVVSYLSGEIGHIFFSHHSLYHMNQFFLWRNISDVTKFPYISTNNSISSRRCSKGDTNGGSLPDVFYTNIKAKITTTIFSHKFEFCFFYVDYRFGLAFHNIDGDSRLPYGNYGKKHTYTNTKNTNHRDDKCRANILCLPYASLSTSPLLTQFCISACLGLLAYGLIGFGISVMFSPKPSVIFGSGRPYIISGTLVATVIYGVVLYWAVACPYNIGYEYCDQASDNRST